MWATTNPEVDPVTGKRDEAGANFRVWTLADSERL
jgi:hypothetical protein